MRFYGEPYSLVPGLSPAVKSILIATVGVFLLQSALLLTTGFSLSAFLGLRASGVLSGQLWQFLTYMFLHGGVWHVLLNMLMLLFFGKELEMVLGSRRFIGLYLSCGVLGGIGWLLISAGAATYCIGASGAVFGIVGAYAAFFPERRVTLLLFFVLPVTMSARTMAIGLGVISLFFLMGDDGNIAHAAHLAGGVAGYVYGRGVARPRVARAGWFTRRPSEGEAAPPTAEEVDRILEKIKADGIGSLSRAERAALERASRQRRG